jgi:Na+-translocating ferredoxin:NAD+ oxidoreductase subunit D
MNVFSDAPAAGQGAGGELSVSAGPHLRGEWTVPRIMLVTCVSLVPAVVVSAVMNGFRVLLVTAVSMAAAAAAEWMVRSFAEKRPVVLDGSACLTGLLLSCSFPPQVPLWMPPLGAVFAIVVVKMAFGGLGRNFLNPAFAGRAFCVLAFPAVWNAMPSPLVPLPGGSLWPLLTGFQGGWIGGSSAGALFLGAAVLRVLRIIDITVPAAFIGSSFVLFWLAQNPYEALLQVCAGGILPGALLMATDPVTSPKTRTARLLFGIACGTMSFVLCKSDSAGSGVMYAVLLMNCLVPYSDRFLGRRLFRGPGGRNV